MKRFLIQLKPPNCKSPKKESEESSSVTVPNKSTLGESSNENTDNENNKCVEEKPPCKTVNKNDVGNFVNIRLSDSQKVDLLTNVWVPPKNYAFPLLQKFEARKLKFCHKWLDEFSWIAYSEMQQGAFCVSCVAFARSGGKGSQPLGYLVKTKFDNWKKAKEVSFKNITRYIYKFKIISFIIIDK